MRTIRYQQIADELRARISTVGAGQVLPSESELSAEFGVSRVTIRRALEILRDEGLVDARQGFGWYVAGEPVRQHLDELGTIEGQLEAPRHHAPSAGCSSSRSAPRRSASPRCSAPSRCCASSASTWPTANRSRW